MAIEEHKNLGLENVGPQVSAAAGSSNSNSHNSGGGGGSQQELAEVQRQLSALLPRLQQVAQEQPNPSQ